MPIAVLPTHLVNKIAAGEIIERPASVVKELVENAVDAGATRIEVRLEDGGRRLISVADNGCGLSAEDLSLAFVPHATSKIATEDDLYGVSTMGFRGEALASIASISHAQIRSRRRDSDQVGGYEVEAGGETHGPVRPAAAAEGTTVTVRDLFFNTPARRKFLRSAGTELGHVSEQLARLALAQTAVAFSLYHNNKLLQDLPEAESAARRIGDLFGSDLSAGLLPVAPRRGPVRVEGLIAVPAGARSSAKWQYFFLNKRYIRDRLLAHALREAYRGLLDPSMSPVAFLFLEVPPSEVDVNVHPTKIEVRFRDGQAVYGELLAALRETLNKADLAPAAKPRQDAPPPTASADDQQRQESLRAALADFFKSSAAQRPSLDLPPLTPRRDWPQLSAVRMDEPSRWGLPNAQKHPPAPIVEPSPRVYAPAAPLLTPPPALPARPATAMQVHDSYIVSSCPDGLEIIDQHALHERLIYNDLRRSLQSGRLSGQRLLIPQSFRVTPAEADCLSRRADLLARLGIEAAPFGPSDWAVQQFPSMLVERGVDAGEFMRELLDKLSDDEGVETERLLAEVLELLACHAAVKAGQALAPEEIDALLARRDSAQDASACPHGRPTTLKLTLQDLRKQFKRT